MIEPFLHEPFSMTPYWMRPRRVNRPNLGELPNLDMSEVRNEKDRFSISLDCSHFKPEEITVRRKSIYYNFTIVLS